MDEVWERLACGLMDGMADGSGEGLRSPWERMNGGLVDWA